MTSGLKLLLKKRFGPFFWTQALGAFNDNVFRFALMFTLAYSAAEEGGRDVDLLMNLAAGLFILPFFLFSGIAGQLADKYEKSWIIRRIKFFELILMLVALLAFSAQLEWLLLALVFAMGVQSALFGPVKYALLPQHLAKDELVTANAWVGMGTFVAILCGTLLGGLLAAWAVDSPWLMGGVVVALAGLGWFASWGVPAAAPGDPCLQINWNIASQTRGILQQAARQPQVLGAILAISWFWFIGSGYLTQFPHFTRSVLGSNEVVGSFLLTAFSLGVGLGALLCSFWSRGKIELGLVPLGALGMALFSFDLYRQALVFPELAAHESLRNLGEFIALGGARLLLDLFLAGLSGGLFIVPLYSWVQRRSSIQVRAQVIAALNVLNALAMVLSALLGALLLSYLNLALPLFYLIYGLTALLVALLAIRWVRDPLLRFLIYLISHTLYRVKHRGLHNIPESGPALVVANHVSYMDALLLAGACHRPLRFVIDKDIHDLPLLRGFLQLAGTLPLASERVDRHNLQEVFDRVGQALEQGELVFIFPEGRLTPDGEIKPFKKGVERLLARYPVPVIPMALRGLWGSWFSREKGRAFKKVPRRFWSRVEVVAGQPLSAETASAQLLQERVAELRGSWR